MRKEPAWKAALSGDVEAAIGLNVDCGGTAGVHAVRDAVLAGIEPHIKAAEQRGYSAGVSKNGKTVRELRQQLAKED